jgi:SusD family.
MNSLFKNRKNIFRTMTLAITLLGAALFTSCSEEFLEPTPLSFYEPGVTLSSEQGMQAVMALADRHLRNYWTHSDNNTSSNTNPMGTEYQFSDLMAFGKTDETATGLDFSVATQLTAQSAGGGASGGLSNGNLIQIFWYETYNGLKYANTVINYIDNVKGMNEATKNAYLGRALFHRAFRYYALVFQFGDVPLITTIPSVPKFNYRSTKKEAILEMITLDLEKAIELVPDQSDMAYKGMVNKGACRMLLIKCYLATGQWQKAKDQADILINNSGYSLVMGGEGLGQLGTWIAGGEPETWPITRNIIWDMHRSENKLHAQNTESIMVMPNRGLASESFRQWLQMRVYCAYWNSASIQTPDGVQGMLTNTRSQTNLYDEKNDITRAVGRGIGVFRPTAFAQYGLWSVNGVDDKGDLRHRNDVGNWVVMTDLRYNNRTSAYYGQNIMLYHPETGALLCNDTVRCWYDWPHYKYWNLDVGAEANLSSTAFNGGTGGSTGGHCDIYLYRLAEAYLLRAEAKFYLGDEGGAAQDVNKIRERARCTELYTTVNIGDIMNERARELHMEEWRNVELSRVSRCLALSGKPDEWGNTYNISNYDKQSGTDPSGGSYWWQRIVHYNDYYNSPNNPIRSNNRTQYYTLDKCNFYWPVRQEFIDSNREGELAQNYGYPTYNPNVEVWSTWQEAVEDESKVN